ncbi:CoA transferase [Pelomyxa schiedti]|nr:CoA transferase [Pelomyxa schiedti]
MLQGLKVVDFSRLLPGPFCTMLLADMGADVLKVEEPGKGDYIRDWAPLLGGTSGFHVVLNRNKRSMTANLKNPRIKDIVKRLMVEADVVVEGFRPGVMQSLGLDYNAISAVNPRVVYCSISTYGSTGPMKSTVGHDINTLALTGLLSFNGSRGEEPSVPAVQIADCASGMMATTCILAALYARDRTNQGKFVDISMADCAAMFTCLRWGKLIADGVEPVPADDMLNGGFACYNLYQTRDRRWMSVGALEPQFWKKVSDALGHPEWMNRYFEPGPHQAEMINAVAAEFKKKDMNEWAAVFAPLNCCVAPVLTLSEAQKSELLRQRNMVAETIHTTYGAYKQLGVAMGPDLEPMRMHAPTLGQHTEEVLLNCGLRAEEIQALKGEGAL